MHEIAADRRWEAFHCRSTLRRTFSACVLVSAAVALCACAGPSGNETPESSTNPPSNLTGTGAPSATDSPPPFRIRFPSGQEHRFRRVIQSSARTEGLPVTPGTLNGVDIHSEVEFLVLAKEGAPSGPASVEVRLGEFSLGTRGMQGEVSFDTRHPESLKALTSSSGGAGMLKDLRKAQATPQSYGLLEDGTLEEGKSGAREEVPGGVRGPGGPLGFQVGWFPGNLPFGHIEEGSSWRFEGALPAGLAGVRYNEPLLVAGTWSLKEWQPDARTAQFVLEGGARNKDVTLRTTRIESCEIHGEATWDAGRGVVSRSSITADIVLVVIENPSLRIDWTLELNEELVP